MAGLLTVERLKKQLHYDRVAEDRRSYTLHDGSVHYIRDFIIRPLDSSLACIYFIFDDEVKCLQQFGFSQWHGHFDDLPTDAAQVRAGIKLARQFMTHYFCCVEELNAEGKYRGSSVLRPNEIPDMLGKDIKQLRRVFFGRAPVTEPVDFSRYIEEEHLFVERRFKTRLERIKKRIAQMEARA
jgi:hypothetical protein